jgi:hypothetical protein
VCHNGVYFSGGGQDIRTPIFSSFDSVHFEISIDFRKNYESRHFHNQDC